MVEINRTDVKSFVLGMLVQYGLPREVVANGLRDALFAVEGKRNAVVVEFKTVTESTTTIVVEQ